MKKTVTFGVIIVSLAAQPRRALAQQGTSGLASTGNMINGRGWKTLADAEKAAYIIGLSEGMRWMVENVASDAHDFLTELLPRGLNVGEVETAVDRFYAEPENILIPAIRAVHIVALKIVGISPAQIEMEIALERGLATSAAGKK